MIRCHLATLMDQRKLRITEVARLTGLNRSTITALYRDRATRIERPKNALGGLTPEAYAKTLAGSDTLTPDSKADRY